MPSTRKLNEYSQAEGPARSLLERLGWTYVPREALASQGSGEREALLTGRLRAALLRLNEGLAEAQAERVVFDLSSVNEVGISLNQKIHEYLTFGLPLTVNATHGQDSRNVRFLDFKDPSSGLNKFVVIAQFRVRRGHPSTGSGRTDEVEDDIRVIKPNLALFANGIPVVIMEAKSPSLMDVWKSQAVRQLCRYQEAGPEWHGTGAPSSSTTTWCASLTAGPPRPMPPRARRKTPISSGSPWRRTPKTRCRSASGGAARAGAAHRGNAGPGHAAGHSSRQRGVRARP